MHKINDIADRIRKSFELRTSAREAALSQARTLTRHCANAIRAVHREDRQEAFANLSQAQTIAKDLKDHLQEYPDIYYAGYTQDALKEYAEASIVFGLTESDFLPEPEELGLEYATYLKGLAEAVGELRRRILDILRNGHSDEVEHYLNHMDDIFVVLTTMDFPDAITGGLRRWTDIARSLIEHTRGDVTLSVRHEQLEKSLSHLEKKLEELEFPASGQDPAKD
jgi:translin